MNLKRTMYYVIALTLVTALGCSTKKTSTKKSEFKTEVKEVISTIYTDTGKIVTIREIEYKTIYDTITKTFIQVKYKVREKVSENKAITEAKKENRVITQKAKDKATETIKEGNSFNLGIKIILWLLCLGGFLLLSLFLRNKFR